MPETMQVKCASCGTDDEIMSPSEEAADHEIRWLCGECKTLNIIEGKPGHPGEGALNPAASALSDEELLEAAERRGVIHKLHLEGAVAPAGEPTGEK